MRGYIAGRLQLSLWPFLGSLFKIMEMAYPQTETIQGYKIILEVLSQHEGSQLSFYSEETQKLIETKKFSSVQEGLKAFRDLKEELENLHNPT